MSAKGNMPQRKEVKLCKILSVEDDTTYQGALLLTLKALNYGDRKIEFLTANSAQAASAVIAQHPDIALVLLDVVMETDDAGLRLVKSIRDGLGNQLVRIVLLTGQPGMMPLGDLMINYDIDDYWNKSDLTHEHLQSVVLGNIRTWEHMTSMQQARQGLQMLIESSQRISNKLDLKAYTQSILEELCRAFNLDIGGIVCIAHENAQVSESALVFAAAGAYKNWANQYLGSIDSEPEINRLVGQCMSAHCHVLDSPFSALYFSSKDVDQKDYVVVVKSEHELTEYEVDLLQIFGENINAGFSNVALHNRLSELAYYDTVTGLHNKNWLIRQIENLSTAERLNTKLFMLHVEELTYSEVLFGVTFGRSLMRHLAAYLKACFVKAIDVVLYERDTLILMVYDNQQDYSREELEHVLHPQLEIKGTTHTIDLTGALIKLADIDEQGPSQILGIAKAFLEQVKYQQKVFSVFDGSELVDLQERYELMKKMRIALQNNKFFIHLQPKISLVDHSLIGYEVLVRWQDDDGSMIAPDRFIPLAETSGLIDKLDEYVTIRACEAVKQLQQANINVPLSVNVAGSEVTRTDFVNRFQSCLCEQGVDAHKITIEVTETQLIEVLKIASDYLEKLRDVGIKISIDDFGAGYSSLSYLSMLNADELKIDRQFVDRMDKTEQDRKIVQMIIELGKTLNMSVIAEGIETQAQLDMLREMGCDSGQGYFIGRPMLIEDALVWAKRNAQVNKTK